MIGAVLFALLALDLAGFAEGDLSPDATAVVAVVLAIIAIALELRGRAPAV